MDRHAVADDMLSRIRQAAIERPSLYKLKPDLLLALCDELIAFRASSLMRHAKYRASSATHLSTAGYYGAMD